MGIMDNSYEEWLNEMWSDENKELPMYKLFIPEMKMEYRNGLKIMTTYDILELYTVKKNK